MIIRLSYQYVIKNLQSCTDAVVTETIANLLFDHIERDLGVTVELVDGWVFMPGKWRYAIDASILHFSVDLEDGVYAI